MLKLCWYECMQGWMVLVWDLFYTIKLLGSKSYYPCVYDECDCFYFLIGLSPLKLNISMAITLKLNSLFFIKKEKMRKKRSISEVRIEVSLNFFSQEYKIDAHTLSDLGNL